MNLPAKKPKKHKKNYKSKMKKKLHYFITFICYDKYCLLLFIVNATLVYHVAIYFRLIYIKPSYVVLYTTTLQKFE